MSPLSPDISECSESSLLLQTPSTTQEALLSLHTPHSSSFSDGRVKTQKTGPFETSFNSNTEKLIETMKLISSANEEIKPYDAFLNFVRQAMVEVGEETAKRMEEEILEIVIKYKYHLN